MKESGNSLDRKKRETRLWFSKCTPPPFTSTETIFQKSTAAVRVLTDDQDYVAVFEVCLGTSNHSGRLIYASTVMIPQPIVTTAVHVLKRDESGKLRKPTLQHREKKRKCPMKAKNISQKSKVFLVQRQRRNFRYEQTQKAFHSKDKVLQLLRSPQSLQRLNCLF